MVSISFIIYLEVHYMHFQPGDPVSMTVKMLEIYSVAVLGKLSEINNLFFLLN